MYCRRCGCEVDSDELYCAHCSKKIRRAIWLIVIMLVCLVAGLGTIIYSRFYNIQETVSETVSEEVEQEMDLIPDAADEETETKTEKIYAIRPDNKTDYSNEQLLDYSLYERYEYDDCFNFAYPSSLYNQISESEQERDGCFGRVIREVGLGCDDDSYVNFSLTARIDGRSISEMTEIVYEYEKSFIYEEELVINSADEEQGIVLLRGYTSDEADACIYNLIHIAPEYIYQMRIYYPAPRTREQEKHINYYLDTMYRMCGFSGSGAGPRSYDEFLDNQNTME